MRCHPRAWIRTFGLVVGRWTDLREVVGSRLRNSYSSAILFEYLLYYRHTPEKTTMIKNDLIFSACDVGISGQRYFAINYITKINEKRKIVPADVEADPVAM